MPDSAQTVPRHEELCSDDRMSDIRRPERRRSRRVRMSQTLRVRPANPKDGQFEEIGKTKDVSQDGVCFVTNLDIFYVGMRVFVTVPYHHPNSKQNYNYLGQIARVESKGNNQKEIAIKFLSSESHTRAE
jgi:PilZ domain